MTAPVNPVAEYALAERIGPTELGKRLGVSKGRASELMRGKRPVTEGIARKLAGLAKRSWHDILDEARAVQ